MYNLKAISIFVYIRVIWQQNIKNLKFTFDNLFSPQLNIPIWVPSIIVNSNNDFSFNVKINQKNYSITKKNKALVIKYQTSSCTDLFYISYLYHIQTKVILLKADEINNCKISASKYFKLCQIIVYSFLVILIVISAITFNLDMFLGVLFFLFIVSFVLTICLYFIIKLKYKIVKDDLANLIEECQDRLAKNH